MNCDRCGGDNPNHVTFCRHCGQRMALPGVVAGVQAASASPAAPSGDSTPCPRCGTGNPSRLRYCAVCGTGLVSERSVAGGPTPDAMNALPPGVPAAAQHGPTEAIGAVAVHNASLPKASAEPATRQPASPSTNQCWRCATAVAVEAAFCQACGADLGRAGARSAALAPPARLVVIAQDGTAESEHAFDTGQLDIGRMEGNVVLTDDAYVCPRHARILWKNGQFWVTDLGSVNGVYARIKAAEPLQHGDLVLIGLQVLRFELVNVDEQAQVAAVERGTRLFGSPAAPRYARLVQRTVEGVSRDVFYISHTRTTIGRETGDIVFTDDPFMSRQHASITRQYDGGFLLADLGSSNGSFLAIRNQRPLNDGDDVRIGQHLFRLKVRV